MVSTGSWRTPSQPGFEVISTINPGVTKLGDEVVMLVRVAERPRRDATPDPFADFDNDGDQDLLVSTGTGNLIQFLVNKHDALVDGTVQYGVNNPSVGGRMPIWLDFNRDHLLDIGSGLGGEAIRARVQGS